MGDHERCVELARLIEPDPLLVDDGHARPTVYADGIWYVWPRRARATAVDTGQTDEDRFEFMVAYGVDREAETEDRDPVVSQAISDAASALRSAIRANRALAGFWEWVTLGELDYEANIGADVRGFTATVTGYEIVP